MTNEKLNTALYEKMFAEQETYRAWLLSQPPEEIIMKEFDITLTTTSTKSFRLSADSRNEALDLVDSLIDHSSLPDFADIDVNEVDVEYNSGMGVIFLKGATII